MVALSSAAPTETAQKRSGSFRLHTAAVSCRPPHTQKEEEQHKPEQRKEAV